MYECTRLHVCYGIVGCAHAVKEYHQKAQIQLRSDDRQSSGSIIQGRPEICGSRLRACDGVRGQAFDASSNWELINHV